MLFRRAGERTSDGEGEGKGSGGEGFGLLPGEQAQVELGTDGSRFQKASKFGDKTARDADKTAREGGDKTYKTGNFATKDAREADGKILDHPSDAETDERRRVFAAPGITDWAEERKLNIQETKGILGKQ